MTAPCWAVTGIACAHCEKIIYAQQTLTDNIPRSRLLQEARKLGAVKRGEHWFCGRVCRTAHEMKPGIPRSDPTSWPFDLE